MNWEIKCNLGSLRHCEPLSGLSGGLGGAKPLENLQYLA